MKKLLLLCVTAGLLYAEQISYNLGEQLYKQTCISCHGVSGKPEESVKFLVRPRDLTKTILDQEQTYKIIRDGAHYWGAKADIMPAFKTVLKDHEIRSIALYISKKFNPDLPQRLDQLLLVSEKVSLDKQEKMLKRGKKIYKRNCSWCHGITGKADGPATTSPVDSIFPYDLTKTLLSKEQIFLYTKHGGKHWGTDKNDMPSWSRKYDDYTLKSVAKYIDEVLRPKK